ncbi:MAG: DNA polymerase III subunit gamma/tau [Lachnospiraceae bacterium]|nr:DNA polymerase III subunit gamma/tau [Lachnospiraceae bacterium]
MSYTALYRKFRPGEFGEVKGQDHIVTTLKNQIKAERIGHAYLFCGTRGTGKTTIAKILAKAVNCESPVDGGPCNQCAMCKAISAGASMNVVEIDAASNNGVDNIREIRDEVQYSPTEGKYRVYIIDEVHMLSIGAFNALLKTLEEPPSYVMFILATTEAHKIPVTILSRCQRYDFKRITVETITDRLKELTERESIEVEEKALKYIAKVADGAMRDALSLLDQCISFYMGQKLTYENVLEVLGAVDTEVFSQMLRLIIDGDTLGCVNKLDEIILLGRDLAQFVTDFTWYLRNLMLVKSSDTAEEMLDMSAERLAALKEEAKMVELETLMRYIRVMSELGNQIRYATGKRVLVEVAFIKLTKPAMENDLGSLVNRISDLEKKVKDGVPVKMMPEAATNGAAREPERPVRKVLEPAVTEEIQQAVNNWDKVVMKLGPLVRASISEGKLTATGDNRLSIVFTEGVNFGAISRPDTVADIENAISDVIGKSVKLDVKLLESGQHFEDHFVEIRKKINIDNIEEEDF